MATISASGVGVRHAVARALATANLAPADATFRVLGARVELQGRSRIARAEATVAIYQPRPVGEWPADKLAGLVNPDGQHPLMVRIAADRPFFMDVFPVTWERWLKVDEGTMPPDMDPSCPRAAVTFDQATAFAAAMGKRLPTEPEFRSAWGTAAFPWGDQPDPLRGRAGPPRYDDLPEVGDHPPNVHGLYDLGAWLWHWTAEGTVAGGRADGPPQIGARYHSGIRPVGFRLAQDG